jgi:hypothetical protein
MLAGLFTVQFPRKLNVIPTAQIARDYVKRFTNKESK